MKFSALLSSLVVVLPLLSQASGASVPVLVNRQFQNNHRQQGNNRGGRNRGTGNNNGGTAGNTTVTGGNASNVTAPGGTAGNVTSTGGTAGNVTNIAGTTGNAANNGGTASNVTNASGNPQTSLTLDPKVIAPGFANNGQGTPVAGQIASLTSTNNFINFCLTVPNLPLTNGQQITTGSCNPAPMGVIPSTANMPSSKFTNPKNGDTIAANSAFTITMAISNLQTGNFVNAAQNYFSAPQQVGAQGNVLGHSHVVVELLTSLAQTTPNDPRKFAFFKGLNSAAQGGILSAAVTNGLPAGAYRLCSINTAANHQPVLVPIAQHGSLDDCVYFTATAGGAAAGAGAAGAANTTAPAAGNAANTTTPAAGNTSATTTTNTTTPATGKTATTNTPATGNTATTNTPAPNTPAPASGKTSAANTPAPAGNTGASNATAGANAGTKATGKRHVLGRRFTHLVY